MIFLKGGRNREGSIFRTTEYYKNNHQCSKPYHNALSLIVLCRSSLIAHGDGYPGEVLGTPIPLFLRPETGIPGKAA